MKFDLKKHQKSGTLLGSAVVGASLMATVVALFFGAAATLIYVSAWVAASPVLYAIHKLRRRPGKFITYTHITYPSKPFPPAEPVPALSVIEREHNATRDRK